MADENSVKLEVGQVSDARFSGFTILGEHGVGTLKFLTTAIKRVTCYQSAFS